MKVIIITTIIIIGKMAFFYSGYFKWMRRRRSLLNVSPIASILNKLSGFEPGCPAHHHYEQAVLCHNQLNHINYNVTSESKHHWKQQHTVVLFEKHTRDNSHVSMNANSQLVNNTYKPTSLCSMRKCILIT